MFDIGWSEMAVIALIALIVIGPKDLPKTMKTVAQWMRKAKSLTREFQSGFDEMVREAELEDARKALESTRGGNLQRTISNAIDPDDEVGGEVRAVEREARSEGSGSSSDDLPDEGRQDKGRQGGEGDAQSSSDSNAQSNAERAASSMSSSSAQPNVAPPHSLTPPSSGESAQGGEAEPASGDEGSKKTA